MAFDHLLIRPAISWGPWSTVGRSQPFTFPLASCKGTPIISTKILQTSCLPRLWRSKVTTIFRSPPRKTMLMGTKKQTSQTAPAARNVLFFPDACYKQTPSFDPDPSWTSIGGFVPAHHIDAVCSIFEVEKKQMEAGSEGDNVNVNLSSVFGFTAAPTSNRMVGVSPMRHFRRWKAETTFKITTYIEKGNDLSYLSSFIVGFKLSGV